MYSDKNVFAAYTTDHLENSILYLLYERCWKGNSCICRKLPPSFPEPLKGESRQGLCFHMFNAEYTEFLSIWSETGVHLKGISLPYLHRICYCNHSLFYSFLYIYYNADILFVVKHKSYYVVPLLKNDQFRWPSR